MPLFCLQGLSSSIFSGYCRSFHGNSYALWCVLTPCKFCGGRVKSEEQKALKPESRWVKTAVRTLEELRVMASLGFNAARRTMCRAVIHWSLWVQRKHLGKLFLSCFLEVFCNEACTLWNFQYYSDSALSLLEALAAWIPNDNLG